MNKVPHKHAALIKAWADGATIEVLLPSSNEIWTVVERPGWYDGAHYRIKPEPKPDVVTNTLVKFHDSWKRMEAWLTWHGDRIPSGYAHNLDNKELHHLRFTFDGETDKLKSVELLES